MEKVPSEKSLAGCRRWRRRSVGFGRINQLRGKSFIVVFFFHAFGCACKSRRITGRMTDVNQDYPTARLNRSRNRLNDVLNRRGLFQEGGGGVTGRADGKVVSRAVGLPVRGPRHASDIFSGGRRCC